MNNPSPAVPVTSSDDATSTGTVEQRHAALVEELRAESPEPAGEVEGDAAAPAGQAPVASPADSADDVKRKERRARLDALKMSERESVDRKERHTAAEKMAQRAAAAEARAIEAEKRATSGFDRAVLKDPLKVMRLMEAEGISADKVAEAIRESLTNPDIAASRAAREAVSPEVAELRASNAAIREQVQQLLARQEQQEESAAEARHTEAFVAHVGASSVRAPLSAALLAHDREEFMQIASAASGRVPRGAGAEALLDAMEDMLDGDVRAVAQKYAAIYGTGIPSPASKPRNGAVKPNTVSNSLAQERGSLVEEEDFGKLSLEERARRLIRSA